MAEGITRQLQAMKRWRAPIKPLPEGSSRDRTLAGKARRKARKAENKR